jgi:hypothetical protein
MWLKWLLQAFAYIAAELFEPVFKQWREPPEVRQVGGGEQLRKELDDDINKAIDRN